MTPPNAFRYSGNVVVSVQLKHRQSPPYSDYYGCSVEDPHTRTYVEVGAPSVPTVAIDSEEAFDATARAAIAFATNECEQLGERCFEGVAYDRDLTEIHIGRTAEDCWPE